MPRHINAIPISPNGIGTILRLPEGAQIEICGEGFNSQTAKVACEHGFYYVFLQELEWNQLSAQAGG